MKNNKWNNIFNADNATANATRNTLGEIRAAYVVYCEETAKVQDETKVLSAKLKENLSLLSDIEAGKSKDDREVVSKKIADLNNKLDKLAARKDSVSEEYSSYKKDGLALIPDAVFEAYNKCALNYAGAAGKGYRSAINTWLTDLGFTPKPDTAPRFIALVGTKKLSAGQCVQVNSGVSANSMRFTGMYKKNQYKELILLSLIGADMAGGFLEDETVFKYVTNAMKLKAIKAAEKAEKSATAKKTSAKKSASKK